MQSTRIHCLAIRRTIHHLSNSNAALLLHMCILFNAACIYKLIYIMQQMRMSCLINLISVVTIVWLAVHIVIFYFRIVLVYYCFMVFYNCYLTVTSHKRHCPWHISRIKFVYQTFIDSSVMNCVDTVKLQERRCRHQSHWVQDLVTTLVSSVLSILLLYSV